MSEKQPETAETPSEFTIKDLIAETEVEEGTYDIPLKSGNKITVRIVTNYRTIVSIRKRQGMIARAIEKKALPPTWKEYLPTIEKIGEEVSEMIAVFTALIVHPKFTDTDVLELCKASGPFASTLLGKMKIKMGETVPLGEGEEIEEEKNDYGPIG